MTRLLVENDLLDEMKGQMPVFINKMNWAITPLYIGNRIITYIISTKF